MFNVDHQQYEKAREAFKQWLQESEDSLRPCQDLSGDVTALEAKLENVKVSKVSGDLS